MPIISFSKIRLAGCPEKFRKSIRTPQTSEILDATNFSRNSLYLPQKLLLANAQLSYQRPILLYFFHDKVENTVHEILYNIFCL